MAGPEYLGGGVWTVPVPIPGNPLGTTLVYALECERGLVLVDAGWHHEESWAALREGLGGLGLDLTDVYGVVVTHYHPDHLEEDGRVFTGDHALPRITPHIGLYRYDLPDVDPLGDFLDSLTRISGLDATEVLPVHQHRFSGLAERAAEIATHHEKRLDEPAKLLSRTPTTLWELASALSWRQPWDRMPPVARQMAAGEVAAHLRVLERRGTARKAGDGSPLR